MSYSTSAHFYNPSVKIGFISFFAFSESHKFHHLLGCYATGINSSPIFFMRFTFFKFNMIEKNAVLTIEKIKTICLTKKL